MNVSWKKLAIKLFKSFNTTKLNINNSLKKHNFWWIPARLQMMNSRRATETVSSLLQTNLRWMNHQDQMLKQSDNYIWNIKMFFKMEKILLAKSTWLISLRRCISYHQTRKKRFISFWDKPNKTYWLNQTLRATPNKKILLRTYST